MTDISIEEIFKKVPSPWMVLVRNHKSGGFANIARQDPSGFISAHSEAYRSYGKTPADALNNSFAAWFAYHG